MELFSLLRVVQSTKSWVRKKHRISIFSGVAIRKRMQQLLQTHKSEIFYLDYNELIKIPRYLESWNNILWYASPHTVWFFMFINSWKTYSNVLKLKKNLGRFREFCFQNLLECLIMSTNLLPSWENKKCYKKLKIAVCLGRHSPVICFLENWT